MISDIEILNILICSATASQSESGEGVWCCWDSLYHPRIRLPALQVSWILSTDISTTPMHVLWDTWLPARAPDTWSRVCQTPTCRLLSQRIHIKIILDIIHFKYFPCSELYCSLVCRLCIKVWSSRWKGRFYFYPFQWNFGFASCFDETQKQGFEIKSKSWNEWYLLFGGTNEVQTRMTFIHDFKECLPAKVEVQRDENFIRSEVVVMSVYLLGKSDVRNFARWL